MTGTQGTRRAYERYPEPNPGRRRFQTHWGNWPTPGGARADVDLGEHAWAEPGTRQDEWSWANYDVRPAGEPGAAPRTVTFRRYPGESPRWSFIFDGEPYRGFGLAVGAALEARQ